MPDEPATDYGRDETIPDDAVLVRGGPMTLVSLRVAESRPLKEGYDFHGLSMFSFPGCDVDEIARRVRNTLPQREICWATAGEIRAKGFGLRRTGSTPGHFSLVFDETPSDDDLRTVLRLYEGKCKDNPYKRARRRRSN